MNNKPDALVFASPPPPVGGIASIVQMLGEHFAGRDDVLFRSPLPRSGAIAWQLFRPIRNIARLFAAVMLIRRGGRVLMFSSAGPSFYEKVLWTTVVWLVRRKPVLAMVDGNFPSFWAAQPPWAKAVIRTQLQLADARVGAQSGLWKDYYSRIFPRSDIVEFSATVAPAFFNGREPTEQDAMQVVFVGWIIPEKGVIDLLDAFVAVRDRFSEARLRLIGPLFHRESFWKQEIAQRGLADHVQILGPMHDRNELIREVGSSAVFVLPSHAEGLPVALLEAMSLGVACVATEVGAIPDLLDMGKAGVVVPAHSPDAIAAHIVHLLADSQTRNKFAAAGRARVRECYSPEKFSTSYLQLLDVK